MPQHAPRLILLPILFFALILGIVACSPKQEAEEPIRSVKLITVGSSELNVQGEYAAEVRARTESRLAFRVGGKILARQAEAGQRVQAGQVLAEVDVQDYALAAQAAQALAIGARAQRDLAASDYKRYEALLAQNFISAAELERRSASLKAAQSSLDQALSQAQSQANQAGYAKLLATTSGVVTGVEAEPGQVVSAGQSVLRFAHDGPRDAVFAVPEHVVGRLKLGQKNVGHGGQHNTKLSGTCARNRCQCRSCHPNLHSQIGIGKSRVIAFGQHTECAGSPIGRKPIGCDQTADQRIAPRGKANHRMGLRSTDFYGAFPSGSSCHCGWQ